MDNGETVRARAWHGISIAYRAVGFRTYRMAHAKHGGSAVTRATAAASAADGNARQRQWRQKRAWRHMASGIWRIKQQHQ